VFGRQQRVGTYRRGSAAAGMLVAVPVRDHHYDPVSRAVAFDLWRACAAEGYEKGADEESGQNTSHSVTLIGVVSAFRRFKSRPFRVRCSGAICVSLRTNRRDLLLLPRYVPEQQGVSTDWRGR